MANTNQNTPVAHRMRYLVSTPYCPPTSSSWDSGYGSNITTPEQPSVPRSLPDVSPYALDGNSPDIPDLLHEEGDEDLIFSTPTTPTKNAGRSDSCRNEKAAPNILRPPRGHFRSSLSSVFFSTPPPKFDLPRRHESEVSSTKHSFPSTRRPDRFVHPRDVNSTPQPLSDRFHVTNFPDDLTPAERLLRHSDISADVFSPTQPRFNPASTNADSRQALQHEAGILTQTRARTTLGSVDHNSELESADEFPSDGSVWALGTIPPVIGAVDDGRGNLVQTGTNAPYFTSQFVFGARPPDDEHKHKGRLAAALDIDLASKLLNCNIGQKMKTHTWQHRILGTKKTAWNGTTWARQGPMSQTSRQDCATKLRPLRILSAPDLRDDFYCSVLAFTPTCDTVAVGLGDLLYRWTEEDGAKLLNGSRDGSSWLTSLAFSSAQGGKSILAFGRSNNMLGLMSMYESGVSRMVIQETAPISCLSWRPTCTTRPSKSPYKAETLVQTEDLLVGDDTGNVQYYVVEWPDTWEVENDNWRGEMTLVARISVHYQQICGLAWTVDGQSFATGGNDNICSFFHADDVLPRSHRPGGNGNVSVGQPQGQTLLENEGSRLRTVLPGGGQIRERVLSEKFVRRIGPGAESWRWEHGAAVKAIAFCPWQEGLVATGGGSNDKCIHFFHTTSGAALATIFVSSQVTSLIWSSSRREIAATFGFVHPGHAVRIAVYSWPDCKQVNTIEWESEHRALYGISCTKGPYYVPKTELPNDKRHDSKSRTLKEGCIAVAASDGSIKFYELWPSDDKPATGGVGMLGGSDILEDLEGIQKEGDIIR